jgi:membrane protease YdiL (CAAX protease family)
MTTGQTEPAPTPRQRRAEDRRAAAALPYTPPDGSRWGAGTALVVLGITLALLVVLRGALPAVLGDTQLADLLLWTVFYGGILIALAVVCKRFGTGSWVTDFGLQFRWFDVFIGLGSAIGIRLIAGMIDGFVITLMGGTPKSNLAPPAPEIGWVILNSVIAVAIVAPICEELLFRGLLLRGFRNTILRGRASGAVRGGASATSSPSRRRAAAVVSVGASALLFAAVHLYEGWGSPITMVTLGLTILVLGVVNGVYAATTKRLGPGIWTHMWFNGMAAALVIAGSGTS